MSFMRMIVASLTIVVITSVLMAAYAGAPVKTEKVAPIADLVAEVNAKVAILEEALSSESSYQAEKKKKVPQAAGVLACLAQAIAEHADQLTVNASPPDLRDYAISVANAESYSAAQQAFAMLKQTLNGTSTGSGVEYNWDELIPIEPLMKEVNMRNSRLRRVIRRPKDPQEDSLNATTLAVLALAIHAHTKNIGSKDDVAKWQGHALELQKTMTELAAALKAKDTARASELHKQSTKTCSACHKEFRDK